MITIKDIASATGVSPTTVSNVINGKAGRVSEETIAKINKAIDDLGYVPNMSARSLVSNNSKVIGFVNHIITRKDANFMEDPFLSKFIGILEHVLSDNGYYLMLRTVETPEQFNSFIRTWHIDGLFLAGIFRDDFFDTISSAARKLPTVLVDSYVHERNICNVGLEDFKGSYMSTKYLIDKGHRRIAYATFHVKEGGVLMERYLGYKAALTEAGIPFDDSLVFECGSDIEHTQAIADAVAKYRNITGIVTTSDFLAANIMSNLRKNGLSIPEDVSIMGFDDLNICNITTPALTTIHQDMNLKGRIAVDFMLELLSGHTPSPTEIMLPPSIMERESVKAF